MAPKRKDPVATPETAMDSSSKKRKVDEQESLRAEETKQAHQHSQPDLQASTASSTATPSSAEATSAQRVDGMGEKSPAQPVAATANNNTSAETPASPGFIGKFDLYSTLLSFLQKKYLPQGATKPQFEAVYKEILKYQAKNDQSMRIALAARSSDAQTGEYGMFSCPIVTNPLTDEELTPIHVIKGEATTVTFLKTETAHASTVGTSSGFIARLELDTDGNDHCDCGGMVDKGEGTLKMHKVWEGKGENGEKVELFEGYFLFTIKNGPTLRRKGFGNSMPFSSPFWGVRARKNKKGEEIGIDAGDGSYWSVGSLLKDYGVGDFEDDLDSDEESSEDFDHCAFGSRYY
ncbi:hypothetical protein NM688_g5263 [Phlebia brevispora]|uniref:Uncharacterized protein n=1 Tax=Phlebia brevispora TaxID=194682 RepID=A0ACC1SXS0_9APHY|nr:hypothetical protein NM688_g5263 [Phlebia brevispora]